jgi:hypothetical protein
MPDFKSLKDLEKYLNKKIQESLQTDVASESRQLMREHIQDDVYSAYTPYSTDGVTPHYKRTWELMNSCKTDMLDSNTLELKNTRVGENNENIPAIIENGGHYTWGYVRNLDEEIGKRPFVSNTRNDLSRGKLKRYMSDALKKRGLSVDG